MGVRMPDFTYMFETRPTSRPVPLTWVALAARRRAELSDGIGQEQQQFLFISFLRV